MAAVMAAPPTMCFAKIESGQEPQMCVKRGGLVRTRQTGAHQSYAHANFQPQLKPHLNGEKKLSFSAGAQSG